jgi:F-type H+-transporting ATPase subunit delta
MIDARRIAHQARALLDVAEQAGQADTVGGEIEAVAAAVSGDPVAARVLLNPVVAPAVKLDAVRAIAVRGGLSAITAKLLVILAEHDELRTLPSLAVAYRARLLQRRNIIAAEVTTAAPLGDDRAGALARRLGEVTGKQVQMSTRVDPSIIGGVVTRVGSTVYDGSVTTQLARMRQKLVENV